MPADRRATYRLQLNGDFTLDDAAHLTPYLGDLGISHLYTSPVLQATSDSTHGYDVVDPGRVSDALGGDPARQRLAEALEERQLGLLLDIVPNHMAISPQNPWWWDVLENGPASRYASYFDVEWDSGEEQNNNRVLLPVLGDHFGRALEAGEIKLTFDGSRSVVTYYDDVFPVDPGSLALILNRAAARVDCQTLDFLADAYAHLPHASHADRESTGRRHRDQVILATMLDRLVGEEPESAAALQAVVQDINLDPDALEQFLNRQNYRLAFWRLSEQEMSYRRFFDINALIALRVEDEQVFRDTHRLVLQWLHEGSVDGLRVDHPDGLSDPQAYFQRLAGDRLAQGVLDPWLLVEKILEEDEELTLVWPVSGTTGYDFLNQVNSLFVDPAGEAPLTEFYAHFTGQSQDIPELIYKKKKLVMDTILGSDVTRLTELLAVVASRHRRYRDYGRQELRQALVELAACTPVYRTYVRPADKIMGLQDGLYVDESLQAARNRRPDLDPELFDFLRDLLLLGVDGSLEADFVTRFQQFTGPVMAKGVEDTLFYCYNRFISLNEVGGDPARFGIAPDEFHARTLHRQRYWPYSLLATSTHDTKRSEDVRARLNVISEMPQEWIEAVTRWAETAQRYREQAGDGEQGFPDANDEYLFYQTLVGAWPISTQRMLTYMEKAARESKRHTSWTDPNESYEEALADFVRRVMEDEALMADVETFVQRLLEPGRVNSLAQTLLKLTVPGIPDFYQGTELWSLTLVDPDNRRPVDFEWRRQLLQDLAESPSPEEIMERADEGLPKLYLIQRTLELRAARPELFDADSPYIPLSPQDNGAAVAFMRGEELIVVVPRFTASYGDREQQAAITLPEATWNNIFTGELIQGGDVAVPLGQLLSRFPVALLVKH